MYARFDPNESEQDSVPERIENVDGYVDYGNVGQVVPTGQEEVRSRLVDDRIESQRRVSRTLHCCQHVSSAGIGDPHARCCVTNSTICPRPECSVRCAGCGCLACPRHFRLVEGIPFCMNCTPQQKGEFPWLVVIVIVVLLFLLGSIGSRA